MKKVRLFIMIQDIAHKIINYILRFLQLQLFITLVALPILLCWGLPISILSPIGNLIFGPILTAFLFLSSLLFFTQLCGIPNSWIVWGLEHVTQFWLYSMKTDSHPWLFGFARPSFIILILIPAAALIILHLKKIKYVFQSVACLTILLLLFCTYIQVMHSKTCSIDTLACNKGELTLIHDNAQLVVIDPGVIGQRISAKSWTEFTLMPHLVKMSGKTTIDCLILMQPGGSLFEAIALLIKKIKIRKILLVCWQGTLTKNEWRHFFNLKRAAQESNTLFERITHKNICHKLSGQNKIIIKPLKKQISQKEITYPALCVHCFMNEKETEVYSYKYKKTHFD
jgi:hypothetical protein